MIEMNQASKDAAAGFVHDIFVWGGILSVWDSVRQGYDYDGMMYFSKNKRGQEAAKKICDYIQNERLNPDVCKDIDSSLRVLADLPFADIDGNIEYSDGCASTVRAAYFLAYTLSSCGWYWRTEISKEQLKSMKSTTFGSAVFECDGYFFQHYDPSKSEVSTTAGKKTTKVRDSEWRAALPGFAEIIPNLTTGDEIVIDGELWCVGTLEGEKTKVKDNTVSKVKATGEYLVIAPIYPKDTLIKNPTKKKDIESAKQVRVAQKEAIEYFALYWRTKQEASDFLTKAEDAGMFDKDRRAKYIYSNLPCVRPERISGEHFYEVDTEFGTALIRRGSFHEELEEPLTEDGAGTIIITEEEKQGRIDSWRERIYEYLRDL